MREKQFFKTYGAEGRSISNSSEKTDDSEYRKTYKPIVINPFFFAVVIIYAITRALEWLFDSNESFWEEVWNKVIDLTGENPFNVYIVATTVFTMSVYWIFGGLFVLMDVSLCPQSLRKYKVQPETNEPVDKRELIKAIKVILFNQIIVGGVMTFISYMLKRSKGFTEDFREVPSFNRMLVDVFVCILVDEIGFYYSHRLFHYKFFYKYFHKQHHEWQSPISITATYCHWLEHVLSNLLPVAGGVIIMQSHISVSWIWYTLATLTTLNNHSGYHLPFSHSPELHDFHHLKFVECYGKLGLLDWLHQTDTLFRKTVNHSRHRILFSLESAREKHPDVIKKVT